MQPLQVTSEFFPGVTFSGTAESIYNEMKALNPDSVGNLTSDSMELDGSSSLAKRSSVSSNRPQSQPPRLLLLTYIILSSIAAGAKL
jgi:hypothetical protein